MTIRNHLATAALVVTLASLAILYLILPSNSWSPATIASATAVALSLGALIYLPSAFSPGSKTQAAHLAGAGPIGATVVSTLVLSAAALLLSIFGASKVAWALIVLALAVFVVGIVLTSVTRKVVDDVQVTHQKDDRYRAWTNALNQAAFDIGDNALKTLCGKIAEELRYAPSARLIDAKDEALLVSTSISALQASAKSGNATEIASDLGKLQAALSVHSSALIALRSHA